MENQSREEKLEFWSLVVEEFENSDKSIKEQCEHNGIPLGQYYNWRKKVREPEQPSPASFVELEASDMQKERSCEVGFHLEYGKDFKIRLSEDFNPAVLKSVITILKSL